MKKIIFLTILSLSFGLSAQQGKAKIAVANPSVGGLHATPKIAAKLIRLEVLKLDKYTLLDEFDMSDVLNKNVEYQSNCLGIDCLSRLGNELGADFMISGSIDGLGNKIAITLKVIDVANKKIYKTQIAEFDNQEFELQRMIEIVIRDMYEIPVNKEVRDRLKFRNDIITSGNVGKINNAGPRVGYGFLTGAMHEYARRSTKNGGLDIFPGVSMFGYQFEGQYVGTENFSALIEGIVNFSGMEQGIFLPTFTVLNGFRFGSAGWEFAFGPGFGFKKTSDGFFDTDNTFGKGNDTYFSRDDWYEYSYEQYLNGNEDFIDPNWGGYVNRSPTDFNSDYNFDNKHLDKRGNLRMSTTWVIAFGRTFRSGSLNIPINVFYSSQNKGGMLGLSVGFNVQNKKTTLNKK
jgi:hypothetical protein